jgi:hypothetical protein
MLSDNSRLAQFIASEKALAHLMTLKPLIPTHACLYGICLATIAGLPNLSHQLKKCFPLTDEQLQQCVQKIHQLRKKKRKTHILNNPTINDNSIAAVYAHEAIAITA